MKKKTLFIVLLIGVILLPILYFGYLVATSVKDKFEYVDKHMNNK